MHADTLNSLHIYKYASNVLGTAATLYFETKHAFIIETSIYYSDIQHCTLLSLPYKNGMCWYQHCVQNFYLTHELLRLLCSIGENLRLFVTLTH